MLATRVRLNQDSLWSCWPRNMWWLSLRVSKAPTVASPPRSTIQESQIVNSPRAELALSEFSTTSDLSPSECCQNRRLAALILALRLRGPKVKLCSKSCRSRRSRTIEFWQSARILQERVQRNERAPTTETLLQNQLPCLMPCVPKLPMTMSPMTSHTHGRRNTQSPRRWWQNAQLLAAASRLKQETSTKELAVLSLRLPISMPTPRPKSVVRTWGLAGHGGQSKVTLSIGSSIF
mmetsp:Transcript_29337/g.78167  ORF Transcript_29337/g.78167 Transcript_29337/m.78167 type:complete len:235 (+) Transcript_29337:529-1233(+)